MKGKTPLMLVAATCLVISVLALSFAGCAPKPAPGQELKVGYNVCVTGPAAEKCMPMKAGWDDCWKYINTELGGVAGYPVKVIWYDNMYDAAKSATIVKRLMDEGCLFFNTHSSAMMSACMEIANRAEFPGIACFTSQSLYHPPKHIYGQMPDYGDDWLVGADYYMKNIWKGPGKPKMALHLLNNPTGYGSRDAARAAADKMGIEIVAIEEHAAPTTSEMESLTRIKAKNPDVLFISSTPKPTAVVIRNAKDLGLYPGIPIICAHASFTKALIDIAGADVVEGVYGVYPTVDWGDDVPGMAKMTEYLNKYSARYAGNMDYITMWANALVCAEILKLAVKNAGYDVLAKGNVESWRALETKGIQKLKDFKVAGLHGPVSYTPGNHRLSKANKVFQIKGGKIVAITGWLEAPFVKYEDLPWWGK